MKKLKISVVIPTRNRTPYLKRLLENLNDQTRVPDEVIVVGHVDDLDTLYFLQSLDKSKFKFNLKFDFVNGGTSKSRNRAISLSEGDVLVLLDDDVILEKNYMENVEKIFSSNPSVHIITGYTFDLVDLTTPWLAKKGDIEYIIKNKKDKFVKTILDEIERRYPDKIHIFEKKQKRKIYLWHVLKLLRNSAKVVFMWEAPIKGKILPSGYRSEFPEITKIERAGGLMEVEWVQGNNFVARKIVFDEFKFNEDLEKLSEYALNEDLEWSSRALKKYRIYITSNAKLMHLRAPAGNRLDSSKRLIGMVLSTYIIAKTRWGRVGKLGHVWATFGIILSQLLSPHRKKTKTIKQIVRELVKMHKFGGVHNE